MKTVQYDKGVGLTLLCVHAVCRAEGDCVMGGTVGRVVEEWIGVSNLFGNQYIVLIVYVHE